MRCQNEECVLKWDSSPETFSLFTVSYEERRCRKFNRHLSQNATYLSNRFDALCTNNSSRRSLTEIFEELIPSIRRRGPCLKCQRRLKKGQLRHLEMRDVPILSKPALRTCVECHILLLRFLSTIGCTFPLCPARHRVRVSLSILPCNGPKRALTGSALFIFVQGGIKMIFLYAPFHLLDLSLCAVISAVRFAIVCELQLVRSKSIR